VPLVCVPLGSDQEYNARRIGVGGLGLWLRDDDASPERIREAMRRVLQEPSFAVKARAFAEDMDRRPGFPATIRRITDLAAARQARHGLTAGTGA
jgi:N-glycosyltransferase